MKIFLSHFRYHRELFSKHFGIKSIEVSEPVIACFEEIPQAFDGGKKAELWMCERRVGEMRQLLAKLSLAATVDVDVSDAVVFGAIGRSDWLSHDDVRNLNVIRYIDTSHER